MDWAGIIVERLSGLKLNDYMTRYIFEPLGIRDLSMFPTRDMQNRLVGLWHRNAEGQLSVRQYPLSKPLETRTSTPIFHSGGAGLFGSIKEFGSTCS